MTTWPTVDDRYVTHRTPGEELVDALDFLLGCSLATFGATGRHPQCATPSHLERGLTRLAFVDTRRVELLAALPLTSHAYGRRCGNAAPDHAVATDVTSPESIDATRERRRNDHSRYWSLERRERVWHGLSVHWAWLAGGFVLAFAVPYVSRTWSRLTVISSRDLRTLGHRPLLAVVAIDRLRPLGGSETTLACCALLGLAAAGALAAVVVRTEDATARPDGLDLVGALAWRGVVYGIADGLLLSVFPILVVFAAFAGTRLNRRFAGKVVIGIVALAASPGMTFAYHSGYSDFRSDKMSKPLRGDVIWSAPTLLTLNPIGAPIAHVGLHTSAVLHSYETDTFLPPHR